MYYSNENLSILQAVTKSTSHTSTSTTYEQVSPPSPVAPVFEQDKLDNDGEEYSYAIISTDKIDLASFKKEKAKAQRLKRTMEDHVTEDSKDNADTEEKDNIVKSRGIRYYWCIFIIVVLATTCFMFGNGMNQYSSKISNVVEFAKDAWNRGNTLWYWQDYISKDQWNRSKTWIYLEKEAIYSRLLEPLWIQQPQQVQRWLQKCVECSLEWVEKTLQSVGVFLNQCLRFWQRFLDHI
ncbi:hypothetical protein BCR42DRAFT_175227 [Absidia repens]|uniref:Uncharacterized protein n=1 Tax=Absidia repens TaxID=90262 RepID=A0A1X2HZI8_9FUNG|nr:hypothetical protein BCR42DRAFT_175227 [Absidia repens]